MAPCAAAMPPKLLLASAAKRTLSLAGVIERSGSHSIAFARIYGYSGGDSAQYVPHLPKRFESRARPVLGHTSTRSSRLRPEGVQRAVTERSLNQAAAGTKLVSVEPECRTISDGSITASDERGPMYCFEVLNRAAGGWFCPDPQTATPYYVVKWRPAHGGAD